MLCEKAPTEIDVMSTDCWPALSSAMVTGGAVPVFYLGLLQQMLPLVLFAGLVLIGSGAAGVAAVQRSRRLASPKGVLIAAFNAGGLIVSSIFTVVMSALWLSGSNFVGFVLWMVLVSVCTFAFGSMVTLPVTATVQWSSKRRGRVVTLGCGKHSTN